MPYIIFQTLFLVFSMVRHGSSQITLIYTTPFSHLWFLFCLVFWKLLLPFLHKISFIVPVLIVISLVAGYINVIGTSVTSNDQLFAIGSNYSISRFLFFAPYFLLGCQMQKTPLFEIKKTLSTKHATILLCCLSLVPIFLYKKIDYTWFFGRSSYALMGYNMWYAFIFRLIAYIISFIVLFLFFAVIPEKNVPFLSNMGSRTMYPYLLHVFFLYLLRTPVNYLQILSDINIVIPIVCGITLTMLLSTNFSKIVFYPFVMPVDLCQRVYHKVTKRTDSSDTR